MAVGRIEIGGGDAEPVPGSTPGDGQHQNRMGNLTGLMPSMSTAALAEDTLFQGRSGKDSVAVLFHWDIPDSFATPGISDRL